MTLWRASVGECGANVVRGDPLTFLQVGRDLRADRPLRALATIQLVHYNRGERGCGVSDSGGECTWCGGICGSCRFLGLVVGVAVAERDWKRGA